MTLKNGYRKNSDGMTQHCNPFFKKERFIDSKYTQYVLQFVSEVGKNLLLGYQDEKILPSLSFSER